MIHLDAIWRKAFIPPDRRPIEEWAHDNVTLPPVLTKRGKFSTEDSRHFIGPLAALRHDRVRSVLLLKPVRGGGTLIADVFAPWAIVNDSASVLWVFQIQPIAEAHAETRQMPILLSVPSVAAMLPADRHKQRKADILFANGLPFIMTGPAIGNLQSRGFKVVICDEPWLYDPGVLGQAKGRLGDFVKTASSKFLGISQGGEEDSDWDMECKSAVAFEWRPKCEGCAKPMPLEWTFRLHDNSFAGAVFDTVKRPDGTYDKDASAASVRYVCPSCGHAHPNSPKTRSTWNGTGDYFRAGSDERFDPENPPTEVLFRWHALVDYPWAELVKEWLSAQEAKHVGNFAPLVNFFQKRCAQMRSDRTVHDTDLPFARLKMETTNPAEKSWPEESARFLTVDRQTEDVYWASIRAWSMTGESRRLWFGMLHGPADIEAKRIEYNVNPDCVAVDSGFKPKGDNGVYADCIEYGWIAVKGSEKNYFVHAVPQLNGPPLHVHKPWAPMSWGNPGEGGKRPNGKEAKLFLFSSDVAADRVMGLIESGKWIEPEADVNDKIEQQYRIQMTAEFKRPRVNKFTGKREMVWVCPSGNNHAFDVAKIQAFCAMITGRLPGGV